MYTIQFGMRAHFMTDEAANTVLRAIEDGKTFVTVPIDLADDGREHMEVTLNVHHIIALIRHRDKEGSDEHTYDEDEELTPRLRVVN